MDERPEQVPRIEGRVPPTLDGADPDGDYVDVRRRLIYLEHSISTGLQWVVSQPNDDRLWGVVRESVADFLSTAWRRGSLVGETAEEAYFVICDRTTMTQDDIDNGRLVVEVGMATVDPAEFIVIRIGLWTAAQPC